MKFMKYTTLFVVLATFLTSCFEEPGTSITFNEEYVELDAATTPAGSRTYTYLRRNDGVALAAGFIVTRSSKSAANAANVTFEIQATSTAIAGVHYTVSGTSLTIPAGEWTSTLPISILPDNLEPGQVFTINVALTGGDLPVSTVYGSGSHRIQISCPSALAGTYAYSTVGWCGGSATGTVTWTAAAGARYTLDDFSMGAYDACYGAGSTLPGGTLAIADVCGRLSPVGLSRWGEVYTFNSVTVANGGTDLIIDWVNDYAESGVSTLSRTDGTFWPSDLR